MNQPTSPMAAPAARVGLHGLLPVIPTPFLAGRADEDSLRRFLDYFLPWLDGYTVLGSTGEAPSLSTAERMRIAEVAMSHTPPGKTVVVGVSHTSVDDSLALARHAQSIGARGVLCAAPYYFITSAPGMLRYLRALDEAIDIELVLYDNPVATGFQLAADTVCEWAALLSNLHTVKLTDHDLAKIDTWHDAGLTVLAGDDPIAFRYLLRAGDVESAYEVFAARVLPLIHVFGIGDEIATSKAVLKDMGLFASAEVLPPLVEASPARSELVRLGYRVAIGRAHAEQSHTPES